jgi:hypothetical protein
MQLESANILILTVTIVSLCFIEFDILANICTTDTCDPVTGCVHSPLNCDDGNLCTKGKDA